MMRNYLYFIEKLLKDVQLFDCNMVRTIENYFYITPKFCSTQSTETLQFSVYKIYRPVVFNILKTIVTGL